MLVDFDPVIVTLGPFKLHWYGLMYLFAFGAAYLLGMQRAKQAHSPLTPEQVSDLVFYAVLGAVLGGRIGYILFYNFHAYLANPLAIFKIWEGGMSFHGGLLGVCLVFWLYGRRLKQGFFTIADFAAPLVPLGLGFGRIGNFINGELWGSPTQLPWGMVFPTGGAMTRHPSQLYEALLEGVLLFIILWLYSKQPRPTMRVSGLFLIFYGSFRFLIEFVRLPDAHIGYLAGDWLTMGHLLSTPMILFGLFLWAWSGKKAVAKA
jgi:phosphatidylglycerol:prolipoprotein diacylglycerol transferase